jgi:hypothetical protein
VEFIARHIIRVTEHAFDANMSSSPDQARNDRILGLRP